MFKKEKRGFTLIELLVVIAIIGILSSVVLASLNSARKKGRDARRIADAKQLQLALELYYDAQGSYPAALSAANLVTPGYIAAIPVDPSGGSYAYDQVSSGSVYYLGVNLETSGHSALSTDADSAGTNVEGSDTDGCGNEVGRYCYDVRP
ncbi:MAG: prepilin-type N-terminal cleavage/methylation domain-containing protein [Patescibacteria group bacterium]